MEENGVANPPALFAWLIAVSYALILVLDAIRRTP